MIDPDEFYGSAGFGTCRICGGPMPPQPGRGRPATTHAGSCRKKMKRGGVKTWRFKAGKTPGGR